MKKRIEHIILMESYLNKCYALLYKENKSDMEISMFDYMIHALSSYYASKQWIKDYDDYDKGIIDKNIRCGVLSQDAIYNLLEEYNEKED